MLKSFSWSDWDLLNIDSINRLPSTYRVYQIRPVGANSAAYIGSARGKNGLKGRVGQRVSDPQRYLSIFEKQLVQIGLSLEFCYATTETLKLAQYWEAELIHNYITNVGKLPPGNTQTPQRIPKP